MEPVERGMVSQFAQENEIQQVIPAFVADSTWGIQLQRQLCRINNNQLGSREMPITDQILLKSNFALFKYNIYFKKYFY